jgi:hypothetical protein
VRWKSSTRHLANNSYDMRIFVNMNCVFHSLSETQLQGQPWSYGSWIYNYLCNQCLSPTKVWIRIPLMARCTRYNIMWKGLSVTCGMLMVYTTTAAPSTKSPVTVSMIPTMTAQMLNTVNDIWLLKLKVRWKSTTRHLAKGEMKIKY